MKMKTTFTGVVSRVRTNELFKENDIRVSSFVIKDDETSNLFNVVAWQNKNMPNLNNLRNDDVVRVSGSWRTETYLNSAGDPVEYTEMFANALTII